MTVGTSRQVPLDRSLQTSHTATPTATDPSPATHPQAMADGTMSSSNASSHGRNERSGVLLDGEAPAGSHQARGVKGRRARTRRRRPQPPRLNVSPRGPIGAGVPQRTLDAPGNIALR